jgi:hypothetical protein
MSQIDQSVTKKYYMDLRSFGPYNIFLVTDRSIYCHVTRSAMNYLLYTSRKKMFYLKTGFLIFFFFLTFVEITRTMLVAGVY